MRRADMILVGGLDIGSDAPSHLQNAYLGFLDVKNLLPRISPLRSPDRPKEKNCRVIK